MYLIVWEFYTRPGLESEFEAAYGPSGPWAGLFAQSEEYLGTELLRDEEKRGRYLTLDRWVSQTAFEAFHDRHQAEYATLDQQCSALTIRETRIGAFVTAG